MKNKLVLVSSPYVLQRMLTSLDAYHLFLTFTKRTPWILTHALLTFLITVIKYLIVFCAESLKQLQWYRPDSGQQGNEERQTDGYIFLKKSWGWIVWALGWRNLSIQKLSAYYIEFNREVGLLHTSE